MTAPKRALVVSAISGLLWGVLVTFVLLDSRQRVTLGSGFLLSPVIGVVAGSIAIRFRNLDVIGMAAVSLVSLYLAAALYGMAGAVVLTLAYHGTFVSAVFLALTLPWAMTIGGFVLWMWPLSYFNHRLVARLA